MQLFDYIKLNEVTELYKLNLDNLYADDASGRERFEKYWNDFYKSDPTNAFVFKKKGSIIEYKSESLIPVLQNDKRPLLLVFGNPAPHSVKAGMFFSYEGKGKEHRIWKTLHESGILGFYEHEYEKIRNKDSYKKKSLFQSNYISPFNIGFISFYSMPSPASGEPWTGITGMRKLLGKKALYKIAMYEHKRLLNILNTFMPNGGTVLIFQKDAYEYMRRDQDPIYSKKAAGDGNLIGRVKFREDILLICSPPTRLIHTQKTKNTLKKIISIIE